MWLGVDGQVGHLPVVVVVADGREPLLDGVLVGAGERRVHEVAGVGVPGVHRHAGGVLGHPADPVDVAEVEGRVDALGEEVHGQRHHVDVAGALAVAEQRALHPVGAGQHGQLGGGHRRAPVVVGVEAEDDRVPVRDGAAEPLDDVGVDVGPYISTVLGRLMMMGRSGVGWMTSITASQISTANSGSVPVKLSGEYS